MHKRYGDRDVAIDRIEIFWTELNSMNLFRRSKRSEFNIYSRIATSFSHGICHMSALVLH